ncbi:MAG: metalloregulator ArsR/SmtB family transcription factor [Gemmatimonadota bacterium]
MRFDNRRRRSQLAGMLPQELDTDEQLRHAAAIIKCLGHPLRLRLLTAMENGEMTVSQLQRATGARQAAVSRQLGIMRERAIVESRREGLNVYYWIVEPLVDTILGCVPGRARRDT